MRTYTFRDLLPLLKYGSLMRILKGTKYKDTNYRLLNIQTVSQAAEYPSQDDKQKQLAARQPEECQTNGRYLTQSAAIQGQSVRQLDESLPCEAASITRLPRGLLNDVIQSINTHFNTNVQHRAYTRFETHTVLIE